MSAGIAQEAWGWGSPRRPFGGCGPRTNRVSMERATHPLQVPEQLLERFPGPSQEKHSAGLRQQTGLIQNLQVRDTEPQETARIRATWVDLLHQEAERQAASTAGTATSAIGATPSPYSARLTGPVQFLKYLLEAWELNSAHATVLLGLDPDDAPQVADLLAGRAKLKGRDTQDRIAHLYRIRKTLSALFRDEVVENQWLRERHTMLDESSPMDLMLEGSMENLLLVREYVEAAAGR